MRNPDRPSIVKIGVAAALAASALLASAATAAGDPGEPDPAPVPAAAPLPPGPPGPPEPPPASQIGNPLALSGTEQGIGGLPGNLAIVGNPNLIGQNPVPAAPAANAPVIAPNTRALNNQYLLPQNLKPAEPGKGEIYGVNPGEESADISGGDYLGRLVRGVQDGQWRGGIVGRGTKESLNQPLPGTAPPPGTRIPGLGDDSQGPAPDQWHWTPPEAPEGAPPIPGAPPAPAAPAPPA